MRRFYFESMKIYLVFDIYNAILIDPNMYFLNESIIAKLTYWFSYYFYKVLGDYRWLLFSLRYQNLKRKNLRKPLVLICFNLEVLKQ